MKCPKCNYVSFDNPSRCRHCGYDFSVESASPADLTLHDESRESLGPPSDLPLSGGASGRKPGPARTRAMPPDTPFELPLFTEGRVAADQPVVPPRAPRVPLSVRRSSSDLGRGRDHTEPTPTPPPRLEFAAEPQPAAPAVSRSGALAAQVTPGPDSGHAPVLAPAPLGRRLGAGLFDSVLLGTIDVLVLHFTLQLTGLELSRAGRLPWAPFLAFIALLNGGYLTVFTMTSGQTIGQMLAGVRVVESMGGHLSLGGALTRTCGLALSWVLAGLGFLPMFLSPDGRALHDRLAGTQVVRD